jgi:hypothetical protein
MENARAVEVIKSLAAGIDPYTGEVFQAGSTLQNPEVVRALFVAVTAMEGRAKASTRAAAAPKNPALPTAAGKAWSETEDQELVQAFDGGASEKDLAARHQRTLGAIRYRLVKLGRLDPASYQGRILGRPAGAQEALRQ